MRLWLVEDDVNLGDAWIVRAVDQDRALRLIGDSYPDTHRWRYSVTPLFPDGREELLFELVR